MQHPSLLLCLHVLQNTSKHPCISRAGVLNLTGYTVFRVRRALRPYILKEARICNAKVEQPWTDEAVQTLAECVSAGIETFTAAAAYFTLSGLLSIADYLANGNAADRAAARHPCICARVLAGGLNGQQESSAHTSSKATS
jgi:hypothetical protein